MFALRRLFVPIGSASLAIVGSGYYFRDELRSFAATAIVEPAAAAFHSHEHSQLNVAAKQSYFNDSYVPLTRWNKNWDNREPSVLVDDVKYAKASDAEKAEMLKAVMPTATRHIFLIRHGQYNFHNEQQNLTELGREQALILGKRLANSKIKFNNVTMSSMTRAMETTKLALSQLVDRTIPTFEDSMLEEGAPYPPEPPHTEWRPKINEYFTEGSRIEAAFRKYIHRAEPSQKETSYELIVCHANVIRYFICRALQFPPEGWLRMSLGHTSITWLVIRPNGYVHLRSCGDIGHLPSEKATFS